MTMKLVVLLAVLFSAFTVTAQSAKPVKIGHIETGALMSIMPEVKDAEAAIQKKVKDYEDALASYGKQYEQLMADYNKNQNTYSTVEKVNKEEEIQSVMRKSDNLQRVAQQEIETLRDSLLRPIYEKIQKAIKEVGDENGFTYILDSSALLYASPVNGEDVLPLVKKKLGLS